MARKKKEAILEPGIEEHFLYEKAVRLLFKPSSHRTTIEDGGQVIRPPSVTTILNSLAKPQLVPWACNVTADYTKTRFEELLERGEWCVEELFAIIEKSRKASDTVKKDAADIGTAAHDWLNWYWQAVIRKADKPAIPSEPGPVRNCVTAILDWASDHHVVPIAVEQPLYSREHKITGRLDLVAEIDGELAVLDNKSTKRIWPEVALQLAPYVKMYNEEHKTNIQVRWAVRMDKVTGEFEGKRYRPETLEQDFETFLAVNSIYERLKFLRRVEKPDTDWLEELNG